LAAGAYEMEVWHERLGLKKTRVSLPEKGVVTVDVVFALGAGRPDQ
jgi:hypothetical protein